MFRRFLFVFAALTAFAVPALAKDELVLAMNQAPGTMNPLISSMLAKSLVSNMTARPLTAYDVAWKNVCLVCTQSFAARFSPGVTAQRLTERWGEPSAEVAKSRRKVRSP